MESLFDVGWVLGCWWARLLELGAARMFGACGIIGPYRCRRAGACIEVPDSTKYRRRSAYTTVTRSAGGMRELGGYAFAGQSAGWQVVCGRRLRPAAANEASSSFGAGEAVTRGWSLVSAAVGCSSRSAGGMHGLVCTWLPESVLAGKWCAAAGFGRRRRMRPAAALGRVRQ